MQTLKFPSRLIAFALLLVASATVGAQPSAPTLSARSWLLVDTSSGTMLASHAPNLKLEPASLAKLMTAYVVFVTLGEKRIALDDPVTVSRAAFTVGSPDGPRMFIEPGKPVSVRELLRGMIVTAGNDAAQALAEHAAGSQDAFVARMNAETVRLGLTNTHFANPTGLSDPQQYSTANDLARLAQRLRADFPQFMPMFSEREISYNGVTQTNRNRLLWTDPAVDGMQTGHLDAIGWSIVATTARPRGQGESAFERRLVAIVLGAPSESLRAQETLRLLNFGYAEYDTVRVVRARAVLARPEVWKGDKTEIQIGPESDVFVTVPTAELQRLGERKLVTQIERPDPLLAPLAQGERVGRLKIRLADQTLAEAPIVALEGVQEAGLFRRAYDAVRLWWRRRN